MLEPQPAGNSARTSARTSAGRTRRARALTALLGCASLVLLALASSCSLIQRPNARRAAAILESRVESKMSGVAVFLEVSDGVRVSVSVQNAPPGIHGVFVCDTGSCSGTAQHFNPERNPHGAHGSGPHHAGDLGNLVVDENGNGTLEIVCADLSVNDPSNSVIGRVVVMTERADDFTTQPNGDAGAKYACGVILADRR